MIEQLTSYSVYSFHKSKLAKTMCWSNQAPPHPWAINATSVYFITITSKQWKPDYEINILLTKLIKQINVKIINH